MDDKILWSKVLNNISNIVDPLSYDTWFKNIDFIGVEDTSVRLVIPIMWYKNHIDRNYKDLIIDSFNEILTNNVDNIKYILKDNVADFLEHNNSNPTENLVEKGNEVQSTYVKDHNSNLNKNYTFESFVVGESNKFAQAAALAVAENPGTLYNPLFIYGNSGLGKTHLMHAIGNYIENKFNKRVLYVTSDDFMNDFTGLARKGSSFNNLDYATFFKNKYRNVDVLLIDDIQFLGGAEKTQQEFFHTFNNLYNDSKQIIVSSDRSPEDLKVLEDRLRTRFAWGLQVDISPPDYDLKVAIIKKKLKREDIVINDDVISFIASNVGNDVRQLEGSITRLVAYSAIMGVTDITLDFAMEALKDFTKKDIVTDQNDIRRIQKGVANFYKISFEDMKSKKRTPNLAIPRQVAMYLCRKLTDESFERIGIEFSGKNHATVIHACNKIEREMKINKDLSDAINNIEKQLT
ncbi:MAG: chromosomal replication initiator protein DnaA [Bacilli bacterium]|nr:chromosomal replication initiator protein DnaA [Bacilli bacterium]